MHAYDNTPFIAAKISAALSAAKLNTTLVDIAFDESWGLRIQMRSTSYGGRGFPVGFSYYPNSDIWANGCASIDPDQEAAIAIVRAEFQGGDTDA